MRLSKIDLNLFVVFVAVYRTRNLTRAAETLFITQPAVSNALARMRKALDDQLFVSTPAGMVLTGAGRRLLPLAGKTVEAAQEVAALAKSMRGTVSGALKLGTIIDPESIRLGPLLSMLLVTLAVRVIPGALYGISASDPTAWASAIVLLLAVSALANLVPAWRAARVDPTEALRIE